jgi:hypothetical protein
VGTNRRAPVRGAAAPALLAALRAPAPAPAPRRLVAHETLLFAHATRGAGADGSAHAALEHGLVAYMASAAAAAAADVDDDADAAEVAASLVIGVSAASDDSAPVDGDRKDIIQYGTHCCGPGESTEGLV